MCCSTASELSTCSTISAQHAWSGAATSEGAACGQGLQLSGIPAPAPGQPLGWEDDDEEDDEEFVDDDDDLDLGDDEDDDFFDDEDDEDLEEGEDDGDEEE